MTFESSVRHQELLERVSERLAATSTATDQLLFTRWRVLGLCQFIVGGGTGTAEELSVQALDLFVREGSGRSTDAALRRAGSAIAQATTVFSGSVLPQIAPDKQEEVRRRLESYKALGTSVIDQAMAALPALRTRLQQSTEGALLAGIQYRLELVAALAADTRRLQLERERASAAILYLDELHDAIPDTLGQIGLLDDDFALRLVLEEIDEHTEEERLHWAERISALWNDLPFLRGVRLRRDKTLVATTWLDRINSYVSYTHALDGTEQPMILVQPSVACSPLHSIVSLIGLLVLEGLTSSRDLLESLQIGQVYEIDGHFYAKYEGTLNRPPTPGWLRLKFRDSVFILPPTLADRMVASADHRLSPGKTFAAQRAASDAEPIQKFFNWEEAIGAASLSSRVLLVTSRQRATELLGGVRSNGISLLDDGLVRFAGTNPNSDLIRSGLVLVVPSLAVARHVVDQGLVAQAVVVDGYERLHRGRHDIPFLLMRPSPPAVIVWSATGYYPDGPSSRLLEHRRLQVAHDDLSCILELDGDLSDDAPSRASLWEAATVSGIEKVRAPWSLEEQELLESIEQLTRSVRSLAELPDYWKYHLFSSATTLRALIAATPTHWSDIREFVASWDESFKEQWNGLRRRSAEQLEPIAHAQAAIVEGVERVSAEKNSKAQELFKFLEKKGDDAWRLVFDRPEQVRLAGRLLRREKVRGVEPLLLRDLAVCKACIVVGWRSYSFGRRLAAHTPRRLVAIVDESEAKRWDRLQSQRGGSLAPGESLLEAVGHTHLHEGEPPEPLARETNEEDLDWLDDASTEEDAQKRVPCVFIWLADERHGKVLARDARVLVEDGDQAREKPAHRIVPEDRVILGSGASRWSPAEEFTHSVVEAIQSSHPELVHDVQEWRRSLKALQENRRWTTEELRDELAKVGVTRETQTLDGWLRLDRASPIGPQHIRQEIEAIWPLISGHTGRSAGDIADACARLRKLRLAAGRALLKFWKGCAVDLGIDDAWFEDLIDQLRQAVLVHEVEAVSLGEVPEAVLGWWVGHELAERYSRIDGEQTSLQIDQEEDRSDI